MTFDRVLIFLKTLRASKTLVGSNIVQEVTTDAPYDIVIMDLTVPEGMGGLTAIGQLIQIDPDVKAIVSSGYSSDPVMANYESFGFRSVLAKPYLLEDLRAAISEARRQERTRSAIARSTASPA